MRDVHLQVLVMCQQKIQSRITSCLIMSNYTYLIQGHILVETDFSYIHIYLVRRL